MDGILLSHSQQKYINITLDHGFCRLGDQLHHLEFLLDTARIEALERKRNGGDVKLRLDAALMVNKLVALHDVKGTRRRDQKVWAYSDAHCLSLQADLLIQRDAWIARVLPHVGHGVVHILEFAATPLEGCALFANSFEALQQAQAFHKVGLYDDAVGKCRVALDQFFEHEEQTEASKDGHKVVLRRVPKLKKTWETALGAVTYAWLDGAMSAIKGAANRTHHSPNAHYTQADSQMLIAITTALVAYAARTTSSSN